MLFATGTFALALLAGSGIFAPESHANAKILPMCAPIVSFPAFSSLTPKQQALLSAYLPNAEINFESWALAHNDLAAEFLANTQALERFQVRASDGTYNSGIDLIQKIKSIEGDRLKVEVNIPLFEDWRNSGAKFKIPFANGKTQTGGMHFDKGNLGGSLHKGYDMQGYTATQQVPRIQFNYRLSDHEADMDLDAYKPWFFDLVPDPVHLTWNNSDPRCWIKEYEKKYGKIAIYSEKMLKAMHIAPSAPAAPVIAPVTTVPVAPVVAPVPAPVAAPAQS